MRWSIVSEADRGACGGLTPGRMRLRVAWGCIALALVAVGGMSTYLRHRGRHDADGRALQFVADPRAGEAYMSVINHLASVTWDWGSAHRVLQAQVLVNTVQTESRSIQTLRLRAGDTDLVLIGRAGLFFCTSGCDAFHLPLAWSFTPDAM